MARAKNEKRQSNAMNAEPVRSTTMETLKMYRRSPLNNRINRMWVSMGIAVMLVVANNRCAACVAGFGGDVPTGLGDGGGNWSF
jgi:hypothetical protein